MNKTAESAGNWRGIVAHAALSDIGLRRANNQDAFAVAVAGDDHDWQARGHLFLVADGMGAHAAGELASKMACESIPHTYRKLADREPADALRHAVQLANGNIHERGQANAEFHGMGTTCSALVLLPKLAVVAHIGDSRVYRLRQHTLEQLTFDHSLVWEMKAAGQMPQGEMASMIPKNIITRSLGPHAVAQIDLEGPFPLAPGDVFLLCSDGLTGQLQDEELGAILVALEPVAAARVLVDMANLRGGPDNITAIVVRVDSVPDGDVPIVTATRGNARGAPSSVVVPLVLSGVFGLAALVAAWMNNLALAAIGGIAGIVSLVTAVWQNAQQGPAASRTAGAPLGNGPHTVRDCSPNAEGVAMLCQTVQQLREAARDEHWTLDSERFEAYCHRAEAALKQRNFTTAEREYALAIAFMMDQIRHQPPKRPSRDSSVLDL